MLSSEAPAPEPEALSVRLAALLVPDGVIVWDEPVARDEAVRLLVDRVAPTVPDLTASAALERLAERDALGPTHIGEGVDLPHARLDEVRRPAFAIGLTRGGVEGEPAPTEVVWLLLLPPGGGGLETTAQVARACRDERFRAALRDARDAPSVRTALGAWERAHDLPSGSWSR